MTAADVAEAIQTASKMEIDRKTLSVPEIRKLGTYTVDVKLHSDVSATVTVEVVAEES